MHGNAQNRQNLPFHGFLINDQYDLRGRLCYDDVTSSPPFWLPLILAKNTAGHLLHSSGRSAIVRRCNCVLYDNDLQVVARRISHDALDRLAHVR